LRYGRVRGARLRAHPGLVLGTYHDH
jgi:hypothetical protein